MGGIQELRRVRVIPPAEILAALPPPYDLIKIDIEGAEGDFIEAYRTVHAHAAAILMEWHSPDKEGSKEKSIRKLLEASDFYLVRESATPARASTGGLVLDGCAALLSAS